MRKNSYWLYGKHAALAALGNPKREVYDLLVTDSAKHLLKNTRHKFKLVDNAEITKQVKQSNVVHQGIAVLTSPIVQPIIDEVVLASKPKERSIIIALDQITDPYNIGAIMRSAAAFGVDAVVVPRHNSPEESATIAKSSSGAIETTPFIHISNLSSCLNYLKKEGYWIAGLDCEAKDHVSHLAKFDKLVIVMGSEGSGMRKLTLSNCEIAVKIPISNIESLNVSVATAIALYAAVNK